MFITRYLVCGIALQTVLKINEYTQKGMGNKRFVYNVQLVLGQIWVYRFNILNSFQSYVITGLHKLV